VNASSYTGRKSPVLLALVIGAWLIISPFVLHFSQYKAGITNNIVCGIALILLTLGGTRFYLLRALKVFMGAWLWASAFILGVPGRPYLWNNFLLALLTIIVAVACASPFPDNYRPTES